jgi:hypothetical protein
MKWILAIVAELAVVLAAVALIGAALPRAHRATRRARFRQKPDTIYAVLAGPPDWRDDVSEFGNLPDQDGRKRFWELSQGRRIAYELVEDVPPLRRVTRIADQGLPFGGAWTIEIAPQGQGAAVRITEEGEIYNVIFRFMARFVFGYARSIEGYLRSLGKKFGETVEIEA